MKAVQPGSWREARASWRRISLTFSRSSAANRIRTIKLTIVPLIYPEMSLKKNLFLGIATPVIRRAGGVHPFQGPGEAGKNHGLLPVRAGGDHADTSAGLRF